MIPFFIPKEHIPSLAHLSEADSSLIGDMVNIANQLAKREGIAESGYRLVINCGKQRGTGEKLVPKRLLREAISQGCHHTEDAGIKSKRRS
ncbi:hypothetical protein ACFLWL_01450 [Chloroflexota bacterium]